MRRRPQAVFAGLACAAALSAPVLFAPTYAFAAVDSQVAYSQTTSCESSDETNTTVESMGMVSEQVATSAKAATAPVVSAQNDSDSEASEATVSSDVKGSASEPTTVEDMASREPSTAADAQTDDASNSSSVIAPAEEAADSDLTTENTQQTDQATNTSDDTANVAAASERWELTDGVYRIATALDSGRSLDVPSGSSANSVQLQLYDGNKTLAQYFSVARSSEEGYYTLVNIGSGKALDVRSAGTTNGTAVQQYASNGTSAQLWRIQKDGLFFWPAPKNAADKRLDVASAQDANGAGLQIYESNGTMAQRFSFTLDPQLTDALSKGADLEEMYYRVESLADTDYVLDIAGGSADSGANLQAYSSNGTDAQKIRLVRRASGLYAMEDAVSAKVLDVESGSVASGANVRQWDSNGTLAQMWYFVPNGDGSYVIHSANSDMVLDLSSSTVVDGTNVRQSAANGTTVQSWVLVETQLVSDDTYVIQSAVSAAMVLDVEGGSSQDGANVQTYYSNGTDAQRFYLHYLGHGLYSMMNVASGEYVDVAGASRSAGANIQQYAGNGSTAQQWRIVKTKRGYTLQAVCSGDYLDVANGSSASGANVQQWNGNGSAAQAWNLKDGSWVYPYGQPVSAMNSMQAKLREAAYSTPATPGGYCALWVTRVYQNAGYGKYDGDARDLYKWYCHSSDLSELKVGMIVAVSSHSHSSAGRIWGHVGVYVGDGTILDSVYGYVRTISVEEWLTYYSTTVTPKWGWLGNVKLA